MKLYFKNAETLKNGISLVAEDLGITISSELEADVTVSVLECDERMVHVSLDGKEAKIIYGDGKARFFRGLAKLCDWIRTGKIKNSCEERASFKTNGAMVSMSNKAVMNVKNVKVMLRKMALMGLNMYMLYTEDTYEIEGRPYFGYMRGRYSKNELKELDAYALDLGIGLIPCIQTLGHLAVHLVQPTTSAYKDTAKTLLVGAEATYKLIGDMLDTVSECFTTRRVHVGMDETHDLGLGAYINKYGYRERREIFFEHLAKVIEMSRERGLEPMMWSDMFFRLAGKGLKNFEDYDPRVEFTDEVKAAIPKGITQVFWDYYHPKEDFYAINIKKHQEVFGKDTIFAGGIWFWSGFCPLFSRSLTNTIPALDACRSGGVEEVIATIWGGSEGSLILSLAGLAWYADYDYKGAYDADSVRECFRISCGLDIYDEIMLCEIPEYPCNTNVTVSRALLYTDPMLGLSDAHFDGMDTASYYKTVTARLEAASSDKGLFTEAYNVIKALSSLLENKSDFSRRLKSAYDNGDKEQLSEMIDECDVIIHKINAMRAAHKKAWMKYNKPFGWEVMDIRYGGVLMRFDTAKERISLYLSGDIERIEDLEETRLRLDGLSSDHPSKVTGMFAWWNYRKFASANEIQT